jgi:threonine synthase
MRESSGTVVAVSDDETIASGWVKPDEGVVCLNTGSGLKDAT